jgi:hypothetical protein
MATPTLVAESTTIPVPECGCPNCGEPLARGRLDLAEGQTVETVFCLNDCDLRPFIFREQRHG